MNEKRIAYKELMNIVEELRDKTIDWTTGTFPNLELNEEVLNFLEDEIAKNNYLKLNKYGKNVITSGWYKKHTLKEILVKRDYFQAKLTDLLESDSYKATQGLVHFLQHDKSENPYIALKIRDLANKTYFTASMSKIRYVSFKKEIKEGERPHIVIISILKEFDDRNESLQFADTEY